MSNPAKDIRKQLKPVVKDLLPEALSEAFVQAVFERVIAVLNPRLNKMERDVKTALDTMDSRQKDALSYLIRQATEAAQPKVVETVIKKEE